MVQFLGPETDIMCQFLGPETDIMGERYYIINDTLRKSLKNKSQPPEVRKQLM
jgi:hypothetical protein